VLVVGAIAIAAAVLLAARLIAGEIRAAREDVLRARALSIAQMFAAGIASAQSDPRVLLVWQPLARTVRQLMPNECAALDKAAGGQFPFTTTQIQAAHAQWTAEWLAWERSHDADYKGRAALADQELAASGGSPAARARLDSVEREKLELYQRRYQDYIQVAKALQGLIASA
jgi:hypothetical protein